MGRKKKQPTVHIVVSEPHAKLTVTFGLNGEGAESLRAELAEKFPYWDVELGYNIDDGILLVARATNHVVRNGDTVLSMTMPEEQHPANLYHFVKEHRGHKPVLMEVFL